MFSSGNRLADALEAVPEEPSSPLLSYQVWSFDHPAHLSHPYFHSQSPLSLALIEVCVFVRCLACVGGANHKGVVAGTCSISVVPVSKRV